MQWKPIATTKLVVYFWSKFIILAPLHMTLSCVIKSTDLILYTKSLHSLQRVRSSQIALYSLQLCIEKSSSVCWIKMVRLLFTILITSNLSSVSVRSFACWVLRDSTKSGHYQAQVACYETWNNRQLHPILKPRLVTAMLQIFKKHTLLILAPKLGFWYLLRLSILSYAWTVN